MYIWHLFIHLLMGIWIVSTFWLLWIILLWKLMYKYLFEFLFSILLGIYPELGLLDLMIILFNFLRNCHIVFQYAPFYIPTSNAWEFQFLHILTNIYFLLLKIIDIPGLPWWHSGWKSACQCRGHGFEPWSGKIPHAAEQLGPWATVTEPARLEPVLGNKRGRDSERPAHHDEEWPRLLQLEKALAQKLRPNTAINK